jgi:SAM-dependent methyltransferase
MIPRERRAHWQDVYRRKDETEVSWYRPHLDASLRLIDATAVSRDAHILDVGGGASTLVDDLLDRGFRSVSVLDVSGEALERARRRLGSKADRASWIEADLLEAELPAEAIDVWHDRAVLHFLVDESDRKSYARQLLHAVKPGGHVILATFAPDGPRRCSDLPVQRCGAGDLQELLGGSFTLQRSFVDLHETPAGTPQPFTYCWFQRTTRSSPESDTS